MSLMCEVACTAEHIKPVPGGGMGTRIQAEMLDRGEEFKDFQEIDHSGVLVPLKGNSDLLKVPLKGNSRLQGTIDTRVVADKIIAGIYYLDGGMGTRVQAEMGESKDFKEIDRNGALLPLKGNNDLLVADKIIIGLMPTPPEVLQYFNGQLKEGICYLDGGMGTRIQGEMLEEDHPGEEPKDLKEIDNNGVLVSPKGIVA